MSVCDLHQFLGKFYTRQVFDKDGTGRMSINKLVEVMSMSGQFCVTDSDVGLQHP